MSDEGMAALKGWVVHPLRNYALVLQRDVHQPVTLVKVGKCLSVTPVQSTNYKDKWVQDPTLVVITLVQNFVD